MYWPPTNWGDPRVEWVMNDPMANNYCSKCVLLWRVAPSSWFWNAYLQIRLDAESIHQVHQQKIILSNLRSFWKHIHLFTGTTWCNMMELSIPSSGTVFQPDLQPPAGWCRQPWGTFTVCSGRRCCNCRLCAGIDPSFSRCVACVACVAVSNCVAGTLQKFDPWFFCRRVSEPHPWSQRVAPRSRVQRHWAESTDAPTAAEKRTESLGGWWQFVA